MFRTADFELQCVARIGKELESFPTWRSLPPTLFASRINTPCGNCSAQRPVDRGIDSLSKNFRRLKPGQRRIKQSHITPDKRRSRPEQPVSGRAGMAVNGTPRSQY